MEESVVLLFNGKPRLLELFEVSLEVAIEQNTRITDSAANPFPHLSWTNTPTRYTQEGLLGLGDGGKQKEKKVKKKKKKKGGEWCEPTRSAQHFRWVVESFP